MTNPLIRQIADYVLHPPSFSETAYKTAHLCLLDSIGCALLSLRYPECTKLLGPLFPEVTLIGGSRVIGTKLVVDPIKAAFDIGSMVRWLDYNDTWLAAEWGHPSDNLGALLALGDYLSQKGEPFPVKKLLEALIMAYEIQGILALKNSFNAVGLDHVILVKVASAAVCAKLLQGSKEEIESAISHAFIDLGPMRTYRHAPCTGSRKSWAAGDATSRGLFFAALAKRKEMGYPEVLSAKKWGLHDVLFSGHPLRLDRPLESYVVENILFKISYPAEFHAQTAVEAAVQLHKHVKNKIDQIETIHIETQAPAIKIIDKKGPLLNPADRDHCLQYMVAVALLKGKLKAEDYLEEAAKEPLIETLRNKMIVTENPRYSRDYLNPNKRSIANRITIQMKNGDICGPLLIEYPIGHRKRRKEGIPLLLEKCRGNIGMHFPLEQAKRLELVLFDLKKLEQEELSSLITNLCYKLDDAYFVEQ